MNKYKIVFLVSLPVTFALVGMIVFGMISLQMSSSVLQGLCEISEDGSARMVLSVNTDVSGFKTGNYQIRWMLFSNSPFFDIIGNYSFTAGTGVQIVNTSYSFIPSPKYNSFEFVLVRIRIIDTYLNDKLFDSETLEEYVAGGVTACKINVARVER